MEKINKILAQISWPISVISFLLSLILILLEMWRPGFVSLYFPMEIIYWIFLLAGMVFVFTTNFENK